MAWCRNGLGTWLGMQLARAASCTASSRLLWTMGRGDMHEQLWVWVGRRRRQSLVWTFIPAFTRLWKKVCILKSGNQFVMIFISLFSLYIPQIICLRAHATHHTNQLASITWVPSLFIPPVTLWGGRVSHIQMSAPFCWLRPRLCSPHPSPSLHYRCIRDKLRSTTRVCTISKGNGGVTEHLSLCNDKLTHRNNIIYRILNSDL